MATLPRLPRRGLAAAILAALTLVVVLGGLAALLTRGQLQAREDLRSRFALRAELAADFFESLLRQGHDMSRPEARFEAGAHLASAVPVAGQRAYLVDGDLRVLAASRAQAAGAVLTEWEPDLGRPTPGATPTYRGIRHPGEHVAASSPVGGTDWMVVLTVPTAQLYAPLRGTVWPQWLAFGLFALVGLITVFMLLRLIAQRAQLDWALRVDPLTGVRNRRHLQERLPEVASAALRHQREWALLMIDVDHFKRINDELGHAGGDEVLREVAHAIIAEARAEDLAGRWGGDEFLVILPDTDCDGAAVLAERISARVRRKLDAHGSLSIGCASGVAEPEELLHRADENLYLAKRRGRGRIVTQEARAAD